MYCDIVVTKPFDQVFTYKTNDRSIKEGQIVIVPFGKKLEVGMVWKVNTSKTIHNIKEINTIIKNVKLSKSSIDFIKWIHGYTLAPLGLVLKLFLINKEVVDYRIDNNQKIVFNIKKVKLNNEQSIAKKNILKLLSSSNKPILLEGVTGSGKTEVYFDLIEKQVKKDKQILIMVPEISLTPQLEERFNKRFGISVDIWHSKISYKRRKEIWHRCYLGKPLIVIGARSSLFLPFKNIGIIIIDEEHDPSYKQEDNIRYQARDLAVVRAKIEKCGLILSSATPSLETINNVRIGKYNSIFLSKQFSGLPLPEIELIDLTKNKLEKNSWISSAMTKKMKKCLEKKEQVLVFLNRRGYSPLSLCTECGFRHRCEQCSSWLVMHQKKKRLLCHHCGTIEIPTTQCPKCQNKNSIKYIGPGVERVAEELLSIFPSKKIDVMSSDIVNSPTKIRKMISNFSEKKIDIIVATQIMAKGYDFPNLSFVGVVDADAGLFGGDMRAIEKTYNLLQQVSGRAGRSKQKGKVMIQTYFPEQSIIKSIKKRDRNTFVKNALEEREQFGIPPFGFMTSIIISGSSKSNVEKYSLKLIQARQLTTNIDVLGPVEAPLALLRGHYRYRILLKGQNRKKLNLFTKKMMSSFKTPSSIKVVIDVDPYSFL